MSHREIGRSPKEDLCPTIGPISYNTILHCIFMYHKWYHLNMSTLNTLRFLGNLIWLVMGGLVTALMYWLAGLLLCCTIIGIPFGVQLFKIGNMVLWPFGHDLVPKEDANGCLNILFNVLWVFLGWWEIALTHLLFGLLLCCTIVGIPWGVQHFKLALGSIFPFGKEVV